jgi:TPR repeat protein
MKKAALISIFLSLFCIVNLVWGEIDLKEIEKLAESGNVEAQFNLGLMFDQGQGVPQNYTEAAKWYRKAAEQGHADAQYFLGTMYIQGQGVPQNYTEATTWLKKAAEQGLTDAQFILGGMYYHGQGVLKSLKAAYVWWSIASESGDKTSKKNLETLSSEMTQQQIAQAQKEAAKLRKRINKSKK